MDAIDLKNVKIRMKPPLSYYGGKQKLSKAICAALYQSPNWSVKGHYVEPYFGGGAVFFDKEPQRMETINDLNDNLIAFYRVVKDPQGFERVKALLDGTLYSRSEFNRAGRMLKGEIEASPEEKAWAVFVRSHQGFGKSMYNGWRVNIAHPVNDAASFQKKKEDFTKEVLARLENVIIENRDAAAVIKSRDSGEALFYLDPPYAGTNNDYGKLKWRDADLADLLEVLKTLKGRFVLSGFPHPLIDAAQAEMGWTQLRKRCAYSMQVKDPKKKAGKIECLTANYPFSLDGWEVFGISEQLAEARAGNPQLELLG